MMRMREELSCRVYAVGLHMLRRYPLHENHEAQILARPDKEMNHECTKCQHLDVGFRGISLSEIIALRF